MKYITTPIYYVNDRPHIGHAYTTMAADILANYWRNRNEEVFFLTGTDEHGQKIENSASQEDLPPQEFVDRNAKLFQSAWKKLGIKHNFFIRTTDDGHIQFVKDFLTNLYRKEEIYKGVYQGLYCQGCEAYLKEGDLKGNLCPDHQTAPKKIREEVYFFKLSQYQRRLIEAIEDEEMKIEPVERRNEVLSFLKNQPLEDLAITRSKVGWGIEVPWDKNQTIYVWVDALLNYLSALEINRLDCWPAEVQLHGKDILRFHGIIWPAMLMAANLPLPKKLFVNGYFTVEGQKMSKTIGNIVDPIELANKYPVEAIRYYLFSAFPYGSDGDFNQEQLVDLYNSHLADNLGNLIQRTLKMIKKYQVDVDQDFYKFNRFEKYEQSIQSLDYFQALKYIQKKTQDLNTLIEKEQPWQLYKKASAASQFDLKTDQRESFVKLFKTLVSELMMVADWLYPFMPEKAKEIERQLKDIDPKPIFPKIDS